MNYYNEIKEILIKNEIYMNVKDYSKNKSDLNAYYKDEKINYYTDKLNLSVRELRERMKTREYERIWNKIELEDPKVDTLIKNLILIKVKNK